MIVTVRLCSRLSINLTISNRHWTDHTLYTAYGEGVAVWLYSTVSNDHRISPVFWLQINMIHTSLCRTHLMYVCVYTTCMLYGDAQLSLAVALCSKT